MAAGSVQPPANAAPRAGARLGLGLAAGNQVCGCNLNAIQDFHALHAHETVNNWDCVVGVLGATAGFLVEAAQCSELQEGSAD